MDDARKADRQAACVAELERALEDYASASIREADKRISTPGRPLRGGRLDAGVMVGARIDPRRAAILKGLGISAVDIIERGVDAIGMILAGATNEEIGLHFRRAQPVITIDSVRAPFVQLLSEIDMRNQGTVDNRKVS